MDYKTIFIRALRNTNTKLNIGYGSPLFDTLILPAADLLSSIDTEMNNLLEMLDISTYFDSEGNIISPEKYALLKNNFLLSDLEVDKASVGVYLLFSTKPSSITIPKGFYITRSSKKFLITEGTYSNIQWETKNGLYAAPFNATAESSGESFNSVSPGSWTPSEIIEGLDSILSDFESSGGGEDENLVRKEDIENFINNRSWSNASAISFQLFNSISNFSPDKYSILTLQDQELDEGIIELEDRFIQTGNTALVLVSFGIEEKTTLIEESDVVFENGFFVYSFPDEYPVYAIQKVAPNYNPLGDLHYKIDYVHKKLYTNYPAYYVTFYTTNTTRIQDTRQQINQFNNSQVGAYINTKGFYPIIIFVDENDLDPAKVTASPNFVDMDDALLQINAELKSYFLSNSFISEVDFLSIKKHIYNEFDFEISTVKCRVLGVAQTFTSVDTVYENYIVQVNSTENDKVETKSVYTLPYTVGSPAITINTLLEAWQLDTLPYFSKNNKPVKISDRNTIIIGGIEHKEL